MDQNVRLYLKSCYYLERAVGTDANGVIDATGVKKVSVVNAVCIQFVCIQFHMHCFFFHKPVSWMLSCPFEASHFVWL